MRRFSVVCMLLVGAMLFAGCTTRFPYGRSADRHNFVSTRHQPLSLSLSDTTTGETIWTLDVPIGKMAVVEFDHNTDWVPAQSPALPAEKMYWDLFEPGSLIGTLRHEQDLPGRPVIMHVRVRDEDRSPAVASSAAMTPMTSAPGAAAAAPGAPVAPADPQATEAVPAGPAVDRPDQRRQ